MSNRLLQRKVSDSQLETVILSIDNLPLISTVTENSTAPITSGAVFSALALKQDTLTFDATPTADSTNPVTSNGISKYIASRGQNLFTNGTCLLSTNFNMPNFVYDGSDNYYAGGCFAIQNSSARLITESSEYMPVDVDKTYRLEYYIKSSNNTSRYSDMLTMYDVDKLIISADKVMYVVGTLTTLAVDLKDGDTTITLTDASKWYNTTSATYQLGVIIWNYTNSFGYTYPAETYSRNVYPNIFATGAISGNIITLKSAWNHGTVPAGTQLSQSNSGGTYQYLNDNYTVSVDTWTYKTGTLSGVGMANTGAHCFWYGTAYVRLGYLINYNNVADTTTKISTISFGLDNASKSDLDAKADDSVVTTSANGLMSSADKTKLDGIATGATNVVVDSALSATSTNAIQNSIVNTALSDKQATLVSGTNIKTIGGVSVLGSGDIPAPTSAEFLGSNTQLNGLTINGTNYKLLDVKANDGSNLIIGNNRSLASEARGAVAIGDCDSATASDYNSTALGNSAAASGYDSTALGQYSWASAVYSIAIGQYSTASGDYSTALGSSSTASGSDSIALGYSSTASSDYSIAIGNYSSAKGKYATAIGQKAEVYVPNWVGFDGKTDDYVRTIALKSTDNIFFRNENVNTSKTTQASYTSGKTLTQVLTQVLSGKQDKLVSGTNIKTINGVSVLGSGNIPAYDLPTASRTTLGGVKIGSNVNVSSDGTISVTLPTGLTKVTKTSFAVGDDMSSLVDNINSCVIGTSPVEGTTSSGRIKCSNFAIAKDSSYLYINAYGYDGSSDVSESLRISLSTKLIGTVHANFASLISSLTWIY